MFKLLTTKLVIVTACVITLGAVSMFPSVRGQIHLPNVLGKETPQENNFSKEKIDLKIDSQCHYYNYDPTNTKSFTSGELTGYFDAGCFFNNEPFGTWNKNH